MSSLPDESSMEVSWTAPRVRTKPGSISGASIDVARESGAASTHAIFARAERFSSTKTAFGNHSPRGDEYYHRNVFGKNPQEVGRRATQGFGDRPKMQTKIYPDPKIGPGNYDYKVSVSKKRSPLDGKQYSEGHIHQMLPPAGLHNGLENSPGPHQRVNVRRDLDHHLPKYKKEPFATKGGRHELKEEDSPGPGSYDQTARSLGVTASAPMLEGIAGGTKKNLKCTFGMSDRFGSGGRKSMSPNGEMYYAHSSFPTAEEYLAMNKSCGFGGDKKVDFSNLRRLHKQHHTEVCAVTYTPDTSCGKRASSIDGFVKRYISPIAAAERQRRETSITLSAKSGHFTSTSTTATLPSVPPAKSTTARRGSACGDAGESTATRRGSAPGEVLGEEAMEEADSAAFFVTQG